MRTQKGGDRWPTFMIFKMMYMLVFILDIACLFEIYCIWYMWYDYRFFVSTFASTILFSLICALVSCWTISLLFAIISFLKSCVMLETYFISKCSNFPCHEVFFQFIFEKKIPSYQLLLGVIWYDTLLETKISPTSGHFWVDGLSFSHVIVSWRVSYHMIWSSPSPPKFNFP